jgi:hypothetical protein
VAECCAPPDTDTHLVNVPKDVIAAECPIVASSLALEGAAFHFRLAMRALARTE